MAGAGAIRGAVGARESDRARAAAQDLAASTLALALSALGVSARSLGVRDLELEGVGEFGAAVLHRLDAELVGRLVASRVTPVLPGGHVFRRDGEIVMLGNGGADLTAVVLAAALGTVPCHFLADRPGRLEPNVRRIHLEAVERARSLGVRIATRTFELGATLQAEERGASAIDAFTPPPGGPL
jgi:aspartokinase